jgi:hypothetical protein
MGSPFYEKLLNLVGSYFDREKARSVVDRQLGRCNATPSNFNAAHLKTIANFITGSLSLYVTDVAKRQQMVDKVKALAE